MMKRRDISVSFTILLPLPSGAAAAVTAAAAAALLPLRPAPRSDVPRKRQPRGSAYSHHHS